MSDSQSDEDNVRKSTDGGRVSLSELRSAVTEGQNLSIDDIVERQSRLRAEVRIRDKVEREQKLLLQEQTERISSIKDTLSEELEAHHRLTLAQFEKELREQMGVEVAKLESELLSKEEELLKQQYELRINREQEQIQHSLIVENERKLDEFRERTRLRLENELQSEFQRRLDYERERMQINFNQELHTKTNEIESELRENIVIQLASREQQEVELIEEEHHALLGEREEQLRNAIKLRLEEQMRLRLREKESRLRAEYSRRVSRMEEDIAQQLQAEIEIKLKAESEELEGRMREDVDLAIGRRKDELRTQIYREMEKEFSELLSDRKERLRDKYDISFSQAVDEVERALTSEITSELEKRTEEEFSAYRLSRDVEIENRLTRFRYDRESELRDNLEVKFNERKDEWIGKLESEFLSREEAVKKSIMSEIDAIIRNERLTKETELDLIKEETSLELEIEMEARLNEYRERKIDEVAEQLEKQLVKREEIMRNKALIEVRRRENQIRKEIEAQLGIKRAEIKNRMKKLEEQMDQFRDMAEDKMKREIERELTSEIETAEGKLEETQQMADRLRGEEALIEKRQAWLGAIAGKKGSPTEGLQDTLGKSTLGGLAQGVMKPGLGPQAAKAIGQEPGQPGLEGRMLRKAAPPSSPLPGATQPGEKPSLRPIHTPVGPSRPSKIPLPSPIQSGITPQPTIESSEDVGEIKSESIISDMSELIDESGEPSIGLPASIDTEILETKPEAESQVTDSEIQEIISSQITSESTPPQEFTRLKPIPKLESTHDFDTPATIKPALRKLKPSEATLIPKPKKLIADKSKLIPIGKRMLVQEDEKSTKINKKSPPKSNAGEPPKKTSSSKKSPPKSKAGEPPKKS